MLAEAVSKKLDARDCLVDLHVTHRVPVFDHFDGCLELLGVLRPLRIKLSVERIAIVGVFIRRLLRLGSIPLDYRAPEKRIS